MNRKLVTTALIACGVTVASAGAVAAGALPGAAQDTAAEALAKVGIDVPGTNDHSGEHPNTRGGSGDTGITTDEAKPVSADRNSDEIVGIATDSAIVGLDKGQAVSTLASDGHSGAGAGHPASAIPDAAGRSADTNADEIVAIATDSAIVGLDKGQAVSTLTSDGHSQAGAEHPPATPPGPPADVPVGPPADVSAGPPADVPIGPRAEVSAGPLADVPAGPPADVPAGPPASLPVGRP